MKIHVRRDWRPDKVTVSVTSEQGHITAEIPHDRDVAARYLSALLNELSDTFAQAPVANGESQRR